MRHVFQPLLVPVIFPCIAGCGLSAYEAKMAAAQRRADDFDRKEVALASAIVPPEGLPVDIALRAPRGIAANPDPVPQSGFFYRYGSAGGKGQIHELLLGAMVGNANVARQQIQKMFPAATPLPAKTVDVPDHEPMTFETWAEGDASGKTYVYLYQTGGLVTALAFRAGKADADVEGAIEASLKTLVVKPR
jgi:hypothetical protein